MNDRIFRVLYDLALRSKGHVKKQGQVFKVAAALSDKRDNILAVGVNQIKSHPIMLRCRFYKKTQIHLHAEADAIRKALRTTNNNKQQHDLTKCRIHVLRLKRNSDLEWMLGNARPCAGCMHLIEEFGIREIFWTEDCEIASNMADRKVAMLKQ